MKKIFTFLAFCVVVFTFSQNSTKKSTASVISVTGTSVGGWGTDVDLSTTDGVYYTANNVTVTAGELKFRQDHAWDTCWGNSTFPNGIGNLGGANIPVTAGTYNITFNTTNKVYTFSASLPAVSLIGQNIGTSWATDVDFTTTDGVNYTLSNYTMPAGEFKFRLEHAWNVAWGGNAFPTGTGDLYGSNVVATAGTYNVTFNRVSGAYSFVNATLGVGNNVKVAFAIYPAVVKDFAKFTEQVSQIAIYDANGRLVKSSSAKTNVLDASSLKSGVYFVDVKTSTGNIYRKKIIKE